MTYAQCITNNDTFESGEWAKYAAVYNWGWIWVDAGEVFFEVEDIFYKGRQHFKLRGYGATLRKYDWMFTVRDTFETVVRKNDIRPVYYRRNTSEGGFKVKNEFWYEYRPENIKITTSSWNSKKDLERDTFYVKECTYDVLTMIYIARNLDFDGIAKNEIIPIRLIIDNEIFDELYIRYLGKEVFTTRHGEMYNTIKFSPLLVEGTMFNEGEGMTVWVTDDKNRVPLQVEAKILVGSVKAVLEDVRGLKHPQTAKIR